MPYNRDRETLKPFIDAALKQKAIKEQASDAGLDLEDLKAEIEKRADSVWESAGQVVKEYNDAEARHTTTLVEVEQQVRPVPVWLAWAGEVRYAAAAALVIAMALFFGYAYRTNLVVAVDVALNPAVLTVVTLVALVAVLGNLFPARLKDRRAKMLAEAGQARGLDKLREDVARLEGDVRRAVLGAISEECNELFDQQLKPSYSTDLTVTKAPGLAEVLNTSYAVNTDARERLSSMLNSMPGGSIGIAGPRGAGKTTLLWAYCSGAVDKIQERPVLGVMTSAPVEYEPRDFILYLFLSVCHAVLKKFNEDLNDPPWQSAGYGPRVLSPRTRANVNFIGAALAYTGAVVILLALLLASLAPPKPAGNANANAAPAAASQAASPPTPSPSPTPSAFVSYVQAFELKPGTLLMWGVFLALPGALLMFYLAFSRKPQRRPEPAMPPGMEEKTRPAYIKTAWGWVKAIKFQQSFTSGWSGALKLPIGLEGNLNRAETLAENQKSLPEIVGGLREFLQTLTTDFELVIGIDELDKIETDERAQQFVNEIKSIFGLRHCFYLVSVSESAMSNFERRGLPFRDAFDSSFDNILHVDYLTLDAAKRLIARRVVGMSNPFRCLCYCASGGLARDLIRTCRNLIDLARDRPGFPVRKDLTSLCTSLIGQDIKSKIRAVGTSVQKIELEPEAGNFLTELARLERALVAGEPLLPYCAGLRVSLARQLSADKEEAKVLAERRLKLAALGEELATFIYYSDTLLNFFDAALQPAILQDAETSGTLDLLARARQSLSIKPAIARSLIDDFRTPRKLPLLDFTEQAAKAADGNGAPPNGHGSPSATLIITDSPSGLQKSIEGLKGVLDHFSPPEEGG